MNLKFYQLCKCYDYGDEELGEQCYCCPLGTVWSQTYPLMCDDIDQERLLFTLSDVSSLSQNVQPSNF